MNASNFLAGIVMVIAGACLLFAGPQLIMVPTPQTQVNTLLSNETFVVGDIWERTIQLDGGIMVNGTLAVSSALTNEPSQVSMLVVDDANYQKWVAHGSPTYLFQKDISNGQSFSFTVPRNGVHHLIFDNTASPVKKKVTVTVDLQRQILVNLPDDRVRYVAYGLLAVGAVVAIVGIVRKTEVPWA